MPALLLPALTLLLAWTAACGKPAADPAPPPASTGAPPPASNGARPTAAGPAPSELAKPAPADAAYRARREMMGTFIEMTVYGLTESRAASAVDEAFAEMEELAAVLSEWRPDSEVSRINAGAGGPPVKVGPHTLAVIQAGMEVSRWSDGAFDLSWAALRGLYLFQPGEEHIPSPAEVASRLPLVRFTDIVVDQGASTVQLARKGMKIGTGGIAKGYTLDRAAQVLRKAGATSFMFFGGGQIQLHGSKAGRPWRVGIQHPRRNDYFAFLESTGGSVSTSGDYEHAFIRDGRRWHHLLDPRTGMPVDHTMSVTVVADSGLYADALSTAIFVMGAERALPRMGTAPGGGRAAIVDADGKLHVSPGMEDHLVLRAALRPGGRLP